MRAVTDEASFRGAPSRRDAVSMKTLGDKIWKAPAAVMLAAHCYWTVHETQSSRGDRPKYWALARHYTLAAITNSRKDFIQQDLVRCCAVDADAGVVKVLTEKTVIGVCLRGNMQASEKTLTNEAWFDVGPSRWACRPVGGPRLETSLKRFPKLCWRK